MAAKKKGSRSTASARKTTRKRSSRTGGRAGGGAKGLPGRASRGKEMTVDLAPMTAAAFTAVAEKKEPRPYTSRYPIDDEKVRKLKESATKTKLAKAAMPASADKSVAQVEIAGMQERAAQPAPEMEPSAAPNPSTSFAGIPATGWLPPDCTLAVG